MQDGKRKQDGKVAMQEGAGWHTNVRKCGGVGREEQSGLDWAGLRKHIYSRGSRMDISSYAS